MYVLFPQDACLYCFDGKSQEKLNSNITPIQRRGGREFTYNIYIDRNYISSKTRLLNLI